MKPNSQRPPQNNDSYRNNTPDNDKSVSNEHSPSYALTSNNANRFARSMEDRSHSPSNGTPMSQSNTRGSTNNNVVKNMSTSSPINYALNNHTFYNPHNMLYSNNGLSKNGYGNANSQPLMHNVTMVPAMRKTSDSLVHDMNDSLKKPFLAVNYKNFPSNMKGRPDDNVGNLSQITYRNVIQNKNEAIAKDGLMAPDMSSNANGGTTHNINNVNNLSRINAVDFITRVNKPGQFNNIMARNSGQINSAPSSAGKAFSNMSNMHGSMNMYHVKNVIGGDVSNGVPDVMLTSGNKLNDGTPGNVNKGVRHVSNSLKMNMAPFGAAHGYPLMGGSNGGRLKAHIVSGMSGSMHVTMNSGPPSYGSSSRGQMSPNAGSNEQNVNLLNSKSFLPSAGTIPVVQDKNDATPKYDANNLQGDKAENGTSNNFVGDLKEDTTSVLNNNTVSSEKPKKRKRKEKGNEQGTEQDTSPKGTKRKSKNTQNDAEPIMLANRDANSDANALQDVASSQLDKPIENSRNGAEMINDPLKGQKAKRKPKVNNAEKTKGDEKKRKKKGMESTNAESSYPLGQQNSEVGEANEYLTEDRNGFYISSSVAQDNMNNGMMSTYGSGNHLNNPISTAPRSDYYNSFNQDRLAEVPGVRSSWGGRDNIKMMNGNQIDSTVNSNIVQGVRYNSIVSNGNTSMKDFMNEQFRENNNAQILRDAHMNNGAQRTTHSYMGVDGNKKMNDNLPHMVVEKGNNEMYKKEQFLQVEQLLRKDQMNIDPKFVWLFLNKEFNENKNKYAGFLPLFNSCYPNKLNELIRKLEEYSLTSYAHVMSGAHALQRKYWGGFGPGVVATGQNASNVTSFANVANAANAANTVPCSSSGYSDGHIDNKLLNNINSNFNELIKNFSIENGVAPNAPVGEVENQGQGRRRRKSDNNAGKPKKEGIPKEKKRAKKGSTAENDSGAKVDSSVKAEECINQESIANMESSVRNCESSINPDDTLNYENDKDNVTKKPSETGNNSYFVNTNGSIVSENASDVVNLILKSDIGNTETDLINNKNECDSVYKGNENSIGNGMTNVCDTISYEGKSQKDENDLNNPGGTLNDMNTSGKNVKVKKYRKKKDNNNLASEDKGDVPTSALDSSTCMEHEKKKRKKKNDPLNNNEHTINAPNGVSIISENGHMNLLRDPSVEVERNENSIEHKYPNGVEGSCAGDNDDLSATYLLNCMVEDYNKEMSKRKKKGSNKDPTESKKKATMKEVVKKEKPDGRGKHRTKKMLEVGEQQEEAEEEKKKKREEEEKRLIERIQNRGMYALQYEGSGHNYKPYNYHNSNFVARRSKCLKKHFLQEDNMLYPHMKGTHVKKNLRKNMRLNAINAIKKKYKRFNFCVNKVFRKNNINDIIALNENLNNNKELLFLFKKKDVRNLKRLNFSYFMGKLELEKIDMIIMKRIHICAQNIRNNLGFTCVINNVENIVDVLKKAFRDRLQLMWPLIEFSSKYRLDQYFHLLTKNRNSSQSRFKETRLFVHQNIAPLIAYFNQRTIDAKIVEHLKSQIKPKKRRRKNKNKDPFPEDKPLDLLKTMNTMTSNNFTTENLLNIETARTRASEFAFVGYNQKRLLTQITPYDYKNILNSEFCNKLFTIKWREQQALFINHLHFDMVPDNEEIKRHFEKVYMRYMGYDEQKLFVKLENEGKPGKPKSKNDIVQGAKNEGKPKASRKRKANKNNEAAEKEPKIDKPRRKYERVKPRKSKNQSGKAEADQGVGGVEAGPGVDAAQNIGAADNASMGANPPNDSAAKEGTSNKKVRKPREPKTKSKTKNAHNNDPTSFKGDPNTVIQASIDFMDPNLFT
ncbi:hypothetical protein AK88_03094 [Plasmodium fragile]|uniref:Uncharacterized protein n=1 Tax=Plasmodium fragile TaxID=5857 RepID=A0A0D9QKI2_PLAFR|nr:uncharacterized protein AK88_03094 [Plasmodium fragile]KJP87297.1 hypothetical protein AK88_03094 [Plasmodium fragile]